ncbi:hypothetical protein Tco_0711770 [Tanacetum coccineum]
MHVRTVTDNCSGEFRIGKEQQELSKSTTTLAIIGGRALSRCQPYLKVSTVMSTGGTIVASHEDVMGFFAKNTTSNNLIRTDFKQKGDSFPRKKLHVLREFSFSAWVDILDHEIFPSCSLRFELLKEQNPSEQSRLRIFLCKEILEGGMIRIHSAFVHDKTAPKAKSLASHISSNGSFQSGAIRIGASVRFFLRVLNASIHSLEK